MFPFVVGCGRSGTTLLRSMLDSHPDLAMSYESHFIPHLGRRRARYERPGGFARERFVGDLFCDRSFRTLGLTPAEVGAALPDHTASYVDAVRRVFACYAARQGKARYGDKTPFYVLWLPLIGQLFPEARFVHIVRDGRDVALSLREMPFGPDGIGEAAFYWRKRVVAGRQAGAVLGPRRYREVRYEALVDDPETVLRSTCEFFALPYDAAMLRYFEHPQKVLGTTGVPHQHADLLLPATPGLRDWRRSLSPDELVLFETIAGGLLAEMGYERATGGGSAAAAFGAWSRWRLWAAKRAVTRAVERRRPEAHLPSPRPAGA